MCHELNNKNHEPEKMLQGQLRYDNRFICSIYHKMKYPFSLTQPSFELSLRSEANKKTDIAFVVFQFEWCVKLLIQTICNVTFAFAVHLVSCEWAFSRPVFTSIIRCCIRLFLFHASFDYNFPLFPTPCHRVPFNFYFITEGWFIIWVINHNWVFWCHPFHLVSTILLLKQKYEWWMRCWQNKANLQRNRIRIQLYVSVSQLTQTRWIRGVLLQGVTFW